MLKTFCCLYLCLLSIQVSANQFVLEQNPKFANLSKIDPKALCEVASNTLHYINSDHDDDFAVHGGQALLPFSSLNRVKETLTFLCLVAQQDLNNDKKRLADPLFLQQHFDFYRWYPDTKTAQQIAKKSTNARKTEMLMSIPQDKIFLTKYYTKLLSGSEVKTAQYNQALYALPHDEQGLTLEQAELKQGELTRYQYTRQQIIHGALNETNLAKPLVWITEEALHDVLLQGTGVLNVDGKIRYFNVHRNNGIAYNYSIGKRDQARYWYFAEVPSIMGYGKTLASKIALKPYAAFAGNVKQLGLGQLFLVSQPAEHSFARIGVLADQGGAFDNNLFQLDFLVGSYYGWADYHQANKNLPDYTDAWLLLKKPAR